jgi:tetratricopeptide (TPR) repeat protein
MLQAKAGFLRLLIGSDPRGASARFQRAEEAARISGDAEAAALALAGEAEIADDRLEPESVERWARALERAPRGAALPIAELCAQRLGELQGESALGDRRILAAAAAADEQAGEGRGLSGRAARLLREAAARIEGEHAVDATGIAREAEAWRATGAVQRWRVAGPFAALRLAELGKALPLDGASPSAAPAQGPAGSTAERTLEFPDGDVGLDQEPPEGDVYYAASRVTLARGGDYLALVEGAAALELRIDGAVKIARVPWPREVPRAQTVAVRLAPGAHQVLVRWSRAEGPRFRVTLARADGAASDGTSEAPAQLSGARAAAPCALGQSCASAPEWADDGGLRGTAEQALARDGGDALAAFFLARATLGDDRPAARGATQGLLAATGGGSTALLLHAIAVQRDSEVPDRLGRSRALADLGEAVRRDPLLLRARTAAAAVQRESERYDQAGQELDRAEQALREPGPAGGGPAAAPADPPPLPDKLVLARARLADAQGNGAKALGLVRGLLARLEARGSDRCDARQFAFELLRREGGLAEQRKSAEALQRCEGGAAVLAGMLRDRGELSELERLLEFQVTARPAQPGRLEQLAEVLVAQRRFADAGRALKAAEALAPRSANPLRRLAGVLDLAGDRAGADQVRSAALLRAPGDLQLRRQLAAGRGEKLLSWAARDGLAIARAPAPPLAPGEEKPSAVGLLDQGAVQVFADGGAVERIHTIVRVLDKRGISRQGEVHVPSDATVLELRTIKPDGRVLEPESIPQKETISLPGLEPGDAVELDYLRGAAPRGPDLPGLSLSAFFFRDEEASLIETTYEARAPETVPLEVDAHNLGSSAPKIVRKGGEVRISYGARDVRPAQPEPSAPSESETLPWLQVGTGSGQREFVASFADWALLRARPTASIDALARAAAGGSPRQTAEAIYAAVAQAVRGRSNGGDFGAPAPHVLAQGRGNRLVVLRAALQSAGISSRIVLVRPFGTDPAPRRFPRNDLFTYPVLRIDLPGGPVWADPSLRMAPFGHLPVWARGQPAWIVPEPGETPSEVRTPDEPADLDRTSLGFELRLAADGSASGSGVDRHRGFDAAALKDTLERMDSDQRKQAIESMMVRALRGVTLDKLAAEGEGAVGGDATLFYDLHGDLARKDSGELRLPASTFPARLQRRWVEKAERALPLLLDQPEEVEIASNIALPAGMHLRGEPKPVALETPFGRYSWEAREEAGTLRLREKLSLPQQRVAPAHYAEFVAFARAVDAAQEHELRLGP